MCMFGGAPKAPPPPAQLQTMQSPKDMVQDPNKRSLRRRGMWASIMTSPQGIVGAPRVTGGGGGLTGG